MTAGLWDLLNGQKFTYRHDVSFDSLIGGKFLMRLICLQYERTPIENLPVVAGKRILPIHIAVPLALWYLSPTAGTMIALSALGILDGARWLVAAFMDLSLWIPIVIFVAMAAAALIRYGVQEFRKNEAGELIKEYLKAKRDNFCQDIEVV